MENLNFLFAAYSATWIVLFLYVYSLWKKQNRIEEGLQKLKNKIEREETPKRESNTG